ncbi:MAG: adenylosuccinate synthase [Candidatus Roizmanbacteria bacterium]|nr:adenylosuccinate synthase [Candidatus Roizmanbacteria bacterium]
MTNSPEGIHGTTVTVGGQWGDEGKGAVVERLTRRASAKNVIRFSGADNAGHTVYNEFGKTVLHLIPSGIFTARAILTGGVLINPERIMSEMEELDEKGVDISPDNLLLSEHAHMIMPWHVSRDKLKEAARGEGKIGTTGRGVGPAAADRTAREGLRLGDLLLPESDLEAKLMKELTFQTALTEMMQLQATFTRGDFDEMSHYAQMQLMRKALDRYDSAKIWDMLIRSKETLGPMIANPLPVIWKDHDDGETSIGEGAQGGLIGSVGGTYPYVTSTNPGLLGFCESTMIPPHEVRDTIAVAKAYMTRVGEGPMPTEMTDSEAEELRQLGGEFGATTGRPRRCGWFDGPATRHGAHRVCGARRLAISKLDILDYMDEIRVCDGYVIGGKFYNELQNPSADQLGPDVVTPHYRILKGWQESTTGARSFADLPENAQKYVLALEDTTGMPVDFVSVGPESEAMFEL